MDSRDMVQSQLNTSYVIVKRVLEDVTEDESRRVPAPGLAPIVWQVGHLAWTDANFAKEVSGTAVRAVPGSYADLFRTGSDGQGNFPPLSQVREVFDAAQQAVVRAAAEADLGDPRECQFGLYKNVGELLIFGINHRGYHTGKIMSLRGLLGKRRLFG